MTSGPRGSSGVTPEPSGAMGLRGWLLPLGSLIYVGLSTALTDQGLRGFSWVLVLPALVWGWRRTRAPESGVDSIDPATRSGVRAAMWGAALWLVARAGPAGEPGLDAAANVGVATLAVGILVALARVPSPPGLLAPPRQARSLDAAALVAFLWGIAVMLPLMRALAPVAASRLDPVASDYASATAGIGSLLVLVAASWRARVLRRLELGVADRAHGAFMLSLTAFLVAVPAALLDVAPPDRVLPIAMILAALSVSWTLLVPDPQAVSRALRGIVVITLLGAPIALIAGFAARQLPEHAGSLVLAAGALCVAVGLLAKSVARPLSPEQTRWLTALDAATEDALSPEPITALKRTLTALGALSNVPTSRPELWQLDPPEVLHVDVAGYLHEATADAPRALYELATEEPERTLRAETLRALQVRRPDVRPLLGWLEARGAFSVTVISDEDGPAGLVLLPRGARSAPMSLAEARAVRNLADRLSALMEVASALSRSRQREERAAEALGTALEAKDRLQAALDAAADANRQHPELLAQSLIGAGYSPAARAALDRLTQLLERPQGATHPALLLEYPQGTPAVPWAAKAHLEGADPGARFVVIDAARSEYHQLETWRGARSPFLLAHAGTLVIQDAAALPSEIQDELAAPTDCTLLLTRAQPSARRGESPSGRQGPQLSSLLAARVGERIVSIPSLIDRAEDLRPMLLERLAREGLRQRGEPLSAEGRVVALLIEHAWSGNERELDAWVERLVQTALTSVVTVADLARAGFRPDPPEPPPRPTSELPQLTTGGDLLTPLPLPTRRRPAQRRRR
ncbi:MAG: hypothetical protein KIT72_08740 [Polyangiaceae bacterium]|nr:hypothetical protein [Polyangiaceae bacterium]MCW5790495.1 hypothetical protein [Polyangiaceae bacterium]